MIDKKIYKQQSSSHKEITSKRFSWKLIKSRVDSGIKPLRLAEVTALNSVFPTDIQTVIKPAHTHTHSTRGSSYTQKNVCCVRILQWDGDARPLSLQGLSHSQPLASPQSGL